MFKVDNALLEIDVNLLGRIQHYNIVDELEEFFTGDEELEMAMLTQPSKYVYCGVLLSDRRKKYETVKQQFAVWEAEVYKKASVDILSGGKRVTEAAIEAEIKIVYTDMLNDWKEQLRILEYEVKILEIGVRAFEMRASLLQSLSAMKRQERDYSEGTKFRKYVEGSML